VTGRSLSVLLALLLAGCAAAPGTRPPPAPSSPAELFEAGRAAAQAGQYDRAQDLFRKLEVYYPDDKRAMQAQIESVYAYYRAHDYDSAVGAAGRFIRLHPNHPNVDYLYYLRGLARFDESLQIFAALPADVPSERPPAAGLALQHFSELIGRFPESRYSEDARSRVKVLDQKLAEFELETAKLLLNRGDYAAARLRAREVIDDFPESGLATEAATVVNMAQRMIDMDRISNQPPPGESPGKAPAPPPAKAPEPQSRAPDAAGPAEPHREQWLAAQKPASYTLQLFNTSREDALLAFVRRHRLQEAAYYRAGGPDKPRYSLLYGLFDTPDDARAAAEKLPADLRGEKPWIRRLADVQADIKKETVAAP
jgi:outer membrane protein assembly factor BamD